MRYGLLLPRFPLGRRHDDRAQRSRSQPNAPFLEEGNSINSRMQIGGKTTVQGTDLADTYLATPSPGEAMSGNTVPAVATKTSPRSKIVSPEDVRRALRQRLGPRYHIPGLRSATKLVEPARCKVSPEIGHVGANLSRRF